jgi:hypothetical protein
MLSDRAPSHISKLFTANKLALNLSKKYNRIYNNPSQHPFSIVYYERYIEVLVKTKFLDLEIDIPF